MFLDMFKKEGVSKKEYQDAWLHLHHQFVAICKSCETQTHEIDPENVVWVV